MKKTYVIAEMAWGHDGSLEQAIEISKKAKEAGADAISIHITDLEQTMVKHYGSGEGKVSSGRESLVIYKYLESINLSNEDWIKFEKKIREIGLELVVMPNDFNSLEFTENYLNPDFYVISAACFVEEEFLRKVASKKRKTIFRIGGAYLGEIEKAINIFISEGNDKIILLHGFQNYPTKLEETNIKQLETLRKIFNCEVGLADHIDGEDPLAKVIPILALAYGATYIEKHITLDRSRKSEDFESALNPADFKEFVYFIRGAEIALGNYNFTELSEAALNYRNVSRKRIVAKDNIKSGELITKEKISFKRSDVGLQPDQINLVINRTAKENINIDEAISLEKLV
jgi:sialic acid synthase SpsE